MDAYVVGSVADVISNRKHSEIKPKKGKCKSDGNKKSQGAERNSRNENEYFCNSALRSKSEEEKKIALHRNKEYSVQSTLSVSSDKAGVVIARKNKKCEAPKEENQLQIKKKKKYLERSISSANSLEAPKAINPIKGLLPLDRTPSDSVQVENIEKDSNEEEKPLKKRTTYKDLKENTIFVGNIPLNYDKQKICRLFSKFGKIQNARVRCVPIADINMSKKVSAIKKKFNPKRNSLVAYVKYKSQEFANAAVKANGMIIDGHHLRIDFAETNKERENNKAVFVGGLPFDIEDDELWEFFQNCGEINSVRIIRDSQTSMGKGFGYVNFVSTASVELALQLNGQELKKRQINVKRCIKTRNKNKSNAFGKKKSIEMTNMLLCKKGKKFKEEKKKMKKKNNELPNSFQGRMASIKGKKRKKLSKAALRQRKLMKVLNTS